MYYIEYILEKFLLDKCKLLQVDTDSIKYEVQCNDAYEEVIKKYIVTFDTSDYPKNIQWIILSVNKKVPRRK